jgi:hypothetical protein
VTSSRGAQCDRSKADVAMKRVVVVHVHLPCAESELPGSFFSVRIVESLSNLICTSWLFASIRIQAVTLKFCGSSVQTTRWLGYACSTKLFDLFSTEVLGHTRARFCNSFCFDLCKHAFGGNQLPRARRSELGVLHRKDLYFETDQRILDCAAP